MLFALTFLSVFASHGWYWGGGDPFGDPDAAWDAFQFAVGLLGILGAHEAGHYVVARRHGMDQTLPFFLPFPMAFGTLGAIIRLRTPPRDRSALLEMGAAGPLAGFAVALVVLALGLPGTEAHAVPELVMAWPPPAPEAPGPVLMAVVGVLEVIFSVVPEAWLPETEPGLTLTIMANPPIMDVVGQVVLGRFPGRYDELTPLGLAGWAGCFLTAMNLLPIGQLDGGHVLRAVAPGLAERIAKPLLLAVGIFGVFTWPGWTVWAILLWFMGAWRGLPARALDAPSTRARVVAGATAVTFLACFMPRPIEQETVPYGDLVVRTPDGERVEAEELEAVLSGAAHRASDDGS